MTSDNAYHKHDKIDMERLKLIVAINNNNI